MALTVELSISPDERLTRCTRRQLSINSGLSSMRSVVRGAMQAKFPGAACSAVDRSALRVASSAAIRLLRDLARKLSYRTGALSLSHRLRNRQVLTVAMFHRVLLGYRLSSSLIYKRNMNENGLQNIPAQV